MFLTGCFMDSMNTTLSEHSLELVGAYLPKTKHLDYVKDSLFNLVTKRLDKEWAVYPRNNLLISVGMRVYVRVFIIS